MSTSRDDELLQEPLSQMREGTHLVDNDASVEPASSSSSSVWQNNATKKLRFDDRFQTQISISLSHHLHNNSINGDTDAPGTDTDTETETDANNNYSTLLSNHETIANPSSSFVNWSEAGKISHIVNSPHFIAKYGAVKSIELSSVYIAVGTAKCYIVGFNYHQVTEFILHVEEESQSAEDDSSNASENDGSISAMTFSSDSSFLAAGFTNGQVVLWDLSSASSSSAPLPPSTNPIHLPGSIIRPYFVIYPITLRSRFLNNSQGHIINVPINSVKFIGDSHSKIITSDIAGLVFFHHGFRKFMKLYFTSFKLLGKNDANVHDEHGKFLIHDCAMLPLGSSHQITDQVGLMAVITENILVVMSVLSLNNPHNLRPITQFKIGRSKLVTKNSRTKTQNQPPTPNTITSACLSWFPCMSKSTKSPRANNKKSHVENSKLAYSWNNVLTILEVRNDKLPENLMSIVDNLKDKDRAIPQLPIDKTCRWVCPSKLDVIVSIKWLAADKLLAFIRDLTGQIRVVSLYYSVTNDGGSLNLVDSDNIQDLQIMSAQLSFAGLDGKKRSALSPSSPTSNDNNGNSSIAEITSLTITKTYQTSIKSFKDRILIITEAKDATTHKQFYKIMIGRFKTWADRLVEFLSHGHYAAALIKANDYYNSTDTSKLVWDGLPDDQELRSQVVKPYLLQIMSESVAYLLNDSHKDYDKFLKIYIETISFLSKDSNGDDSGTLSYLLESVFEASHNPEKFFNSLEPYILMGGISGLSPTILKKLVEHYIKTGRGETLTEIICILDTRALDIDLTLNLCNQYNLRDCSIYIWNYLLRDYSTPLIDFLKEIANVTLLNSSNEDLLKVYPYISYILTGRQYPTEKFIEFDQEELARTTICDILFKLGPQNESLQLHQILPDSIFPYLTILLKFNSSATLSALNEFFENPCLNDHPTTTKITRQYICDALIDVYDSADHDFFSQYDHTQLSIFLARNYPKYPQFIRLPESRLNILVDDLCSNTDQEIIYDCELALQSLLPVYEPEDDGLLLEKLKAANFYDVLIHIYKSENRYDKVIHVYLDRRARDSSINSAHMESLSVILEGGFQAVHNNVTDRLNFINTIKTRFRDLLEIDLIGFFEVVDEYDPKLHERILQIDDDKWRYKYLQLLFQNDNKPEKVVTTSAELISKYAELMCQYNASTKDLDSFVTKYVSVIATQKGVFNHLKRVFGKEQLMSTLAILYMHDGAYYEALTELIKVMIDLSSQSDLRHNQQMFTDKFEPLFRSSLNICECPETYQQRVGDMLLNEKMWLELIESLVIMANTTSHHPDNNKSLTGYLNECIHQSFRRVVDAKLNPNASDNVGKEKSFVAIFNRFLEHSSQNAKIATLSNVRSILRDVFISYSYESEILTISLRMINEGIYSSMREIKLDKLKGWDIKDKACTSCGKVMWGPGISDDHIKAWEARESDALVVSQVIDNKVLATPMDKAEYMQCELTFFKCSHGYHSQCLHNLGNRSASRACVICTDI